MLYHLVPRHQQSEPTVSKQWDLVWHGTQAAMICWSTKEQFSNAAVYILYQYIVLRDPNESVVPHGSDYLQD
jgi:hypothetical protein